MIEFIVWLIDYWFWLMVIVVLSTVAHEAAHAAMGRLLGCECLRWEITHKTAYVCLTGLDDPRVQLPVVIAGPLVNLLLICMGSAFEVQVINTVILISALWPRGHTETGADTKSDGTRIMECVQRLCAERWTEEE